MPRINDTHNPDSPRLPPQVHDPDRLKWQPLFANQTKVRNRADRQGNPSWVAYMVVIALIIIAVFAGLTYPQEVKACLSTMADIGSNDAEAQIKGLLVVGLIGVVLVAVVRILTNQNRRS